MNDRRGTRLEFAALPSGVFVPSTSITNFSSEKGTTYLAVKEKAKQLENLFEAHGLSITRSPALQSFIRDAQILSDEWFCSKSKELPAPLLFSTIQLDRIATSVLAATDDPGIEELLPKLLDGSPDCFLRNRTRAKDTLWELDTYAIMKADGIKVSLGEPDIIADVGGENIGIACKKIYSEANFSKVISGAVAQIETTGRMGLVAVNLDDTFSPGVVLKGQSLAAISATLSQRNDRFMLARAHAQKVSSRRARAFCLCFIGGNRRRSAHPSALLQCARNHGLVCPQPPATTGQEDESAI